mmetsp:Transcript_8500/g.21113  ORF Transcript_8500/g.21113 Transcript_8500/m.21113 type:complete len:239 (-) Transcript_8500:382-1098(-)
MALLNSCLSVSTRNGSTITEGSSWVMRRMRCFLFSDKSSVNPPGFRTMYMVSGSSSGRSMKGISRPENCPPTEMYRVHASRRDICQILVPWRCSIGVAFDSRSFSSNIIRYPSARSNTSSSARCSPWLRIASSGSMLLEPCCFFPTAARRLMRRARNWSHSTWRFSCRVRMRRSRTSSNRWNTCICCSFCNLSSRSLRRVSPKMESASLSSCSRSSPPASNSWSPDAPVNCALPPPVV